MLEFLLSYQIVTHLSFDDRAVRQSAVGQRVAQLSSQGDALFSEGNRLYRAGQFQAAIATWQQALQIYKTQEKTNKAAFVLARIGAAYADENQFQLAIEHYQEALTLTEIVPNSGLRAALLGSIGSAHRSLGDYQIAIDHQLEAVSIYESSVDDPLKHSKVLGNLGNTYAVLGSYEMAEHCLLQSLEIARTAAADQPAARDRHIATVLSNLGNLQLEQRSYSAALDYYQQSLNLSNQVGNSDFAIHTLMEIGGVHHLEKRYGQAIQVWQKGLEQAQVADDTRLAAELMTRLGSAYAASQNYPQALQRFESAIASFQAMGLQRETATALNNRAHAYLTQAGKPELSETQQRQRLLQQAETDLKQSIAILDNLRQPLPDDAARIALFDTQTSTYNLLQQVQIRQQRFAAALETSEQGRARASLALLNDRLSTGKTQFSIENLKTTAKKRNATIVEYTLVPDDSFVHMGRQRGGVAEVYIWLINPNGEIAFEKVDLRDREASLTQLIQDSRVAIGLRNRAGIQIDYTGPPQTEQLHQLYQYLIAPIAHKLPDHPDEEVIFIPQGELFLVPFAALSTGPDSGYLIDRHTISVAPSIQLLALNQQQRSSEISDWTANDFLIVGNPVMPEVWDPAQAETVSLSDLPNAQTEAESIAALFGAEAYVQAEATENRVKQLLEDKTVLHFATHGLLDHGKPGTLGMRSNPGAIALTPSHGDDGLLTSAEIFETSLRADLVVLSACDTGLGEITGDGVVGLSRSFMAAGASSVVLSLWSVPDAPTATLMTEFYKALQQTPHKPQALRQAMLQTKQAYPTPRDWAAFMLMGEAQ